MATQKKMCQLKLTNRLWNQNRALTRHPRNNQAIKQQKLQPCNRENKSKWTKLRRLKLKEKLYWKQKTKLKLGQKSKNYWSCKKNRRSYCKNKKRKNLKGNNRNNNLNQKSLLVIEKHRKWNKCARSCKSKKLKKHRT